MARIYQLNQEKKKLRAAGRRANSDTNANEPALKPGPKSFVHDSIAIIEASYEATPPTTLDSRGGKFSLRLTNHACLQCEVEIDCDHGVAHVGHINSIGLTFTGPCEFEFLRRLIASLAVELGIEHPRQEVLDCEALADAHSQAEQDLDNIPDGVLELSSHPAL